MTGHGPVVPFPTQKLRELTPRFVKLMHTLRQWREEDHEDNKLICRSDVIEIIEGVDALIQSQDQRGPTRLRRSWLALKRD